MFRSFLFVSLLLTACGPENDQGSDSPFLAAPNPMATNQGGAPPTAFDAGLPGVDAGGHGAADAGAVPHVNLAEQVWLAQEDVWKVGMNTRAGACKDALSWLIAVKQKTGLVQNGTYVETSSGSSFSPGGNTLKVSKPGWSGELRVNALVGNVLLSGFPKSSDMVDVSWLWHDGTFGRCELHEKSDHIYGSFKVDSEWVTLDFTTSETSEAFSSFDQQTGTALVVTDGQRTVNGTLSSLDGSRWVNVHTDSTWAGCNGSPCYSATFTSTNAHTVSLRLDGIQWSLNYLTGYTIDTPGAVKADAWSGVVTGPVSGQLVQTPVSSVWSLDVVIGPDRHAVAVAIRVL